jgi:hypothetical protein
VTQCEKETKKRGFKVRNGGAERVEKENERVEKEKERVEKEKERVEKENERVEKEKERVEKEKERVEKENERVEKENERVGSFRGGFFRVGSSPEGKRTAEKKRFFLKREKTFKLTRGRCNNSEICLFSGPVRPLLRHNALVCEAVSSGPRQAPIFGLFFGPALAIANQLAHHFRAHSFRGLQAAFPSCA